MENSTLILNNPLFVAGEHINTEQDTRKISVEKYVRSLVHASQCKDASCKLSNCRKMKRIVLHTKQCKKRINGNCSICKQLLGVCCSHVKHCEEIQCPVPFCMNVKQKLEEQRLPHASPVRRKKGATSLQEMDTKQQTERESRARETLQQLIEILKSPNTPEKQNQITCMLRDNPSLVKALVKLRQALLAKKSAILHQRKSLSMSAYEQKKRVQRRREWLKQQQQLLLKKRKQEELHQSDTSQIESQIQDDSAVRHLIHACQCKDSDCRLRKCKKMKRVVQHTKTCQKRTSGGCPVCKNLVALCCHHVRHCLEADCSVPFCCSIKQKLEARRYDAAGEVQVKEQDK